MKKLALIFTLVGVFFSLNVESALAAKIGRVGSAEVYQVRGDDKHCNFFNSCVQAGQNLQVKLIDIAYEDGSPVPDGTSIRVYLDATTANCQNPSQSYGLNEYVTVQNGAISTEIWGTNIKTNCSYKLTVSIPDPKSIWVWDSHVKTYTASPMAVLQCDDSEEQCNTNASVVANYDLCKQQIKEGTEEFIACQDCFSNNGIWTAVGCIPSNPESVIKTVITIGLAAGGGIVLIMILVGSFMLSVSQGDPNKTKEAKEIITSAIIGLLFVIFSVTILQFIGVSILRIPGFGQ